MGNLVSFPILCLVNKACYDIVCDIMHGPFSGRKARFNGDDCLFNGDQRFYDLWSEVTSTFGLIVNHDKTGQSSRFLELNSRTYDARAHRFVAKPVLSFLLRERDSKECLITQILEGIASFGSSVKEYTLNVIMRREISFRDIRIQTLPTKWLSRLIKRAWFRNALVRGPVPLKESGIKRTVEMVVDRPPKSRFYRLVDSLGDDARSDYISEWKGVKVRPHREWFRRNDIGRWIHQTREPSMPLYRLRFGPRVWRFVWPKVVRDFLVDKGAFERITLSEPECQAEWLDDHLNLHPVNLHTFSIERREFPQPPDLDFRAQFPLGYR